MKISLQILILMSAGMITGCKARESGNESGLRDATGGNATFTVTYPGTFIQDVPNVDVAGLQANNPDADFGRFILTFNHDNQTDAELNDPSGSSTDAVHAFGKVSNGGKTLLMSMGHAVDLATAAGSSKPEWRGDWPCQDAFAMVEERSVPSWGQDESSVCTVGFVGDSAITKDTNEGSFSFGIMAK